MTQTLTNPVETLDPERQQKAKAYAGIRRRLFLVELALGAIYVLVFVLAGFSPWLRDQIHHMQAGNLGVVD